MLMIRASLAGGVDLEYEFPVSSEMEWKDGVVGKESLAYEISMRINCFLTKKFLKNGGIGIISLAHQQLSLCFACRDECETSLAVNEWVPVEGLRFLDVTEEDQ